MPNQLLGPSLPRFGEWRVRSRPSACDYRPRFECLSFVTRRVARLSMPRCSFLRSFFQRTSPFPSCAGCFRPATRFFCLEDGHSFFDSFFSSISSVTSPAAVFSFSHSPSPFLSPCSVLVLIVRSSCPVRRSRFPVILSPPLTVVPFWFPRSQFYCFFLFPLTALDRWSFSKKHFLLSQPRCRATNK